MPTEDPWPQTAQWLQLPHCEPRKQRNLFDCGAPGSLKKNSDTNHGCPAVWSNGSHHVSRASASKGGFALRPANLEVIQRRARCHIHIPSRADVATKDRNQLLAGIIHHGFKVASTQARCTSAMLLVKPNGYGQRDRPLGKAWFDPSGSKQIYHTGGGRYPAKSTVGMVSNRRGHLDPTILVIGFPSSCPLEPCRASKANRIHRPGDKATGLPNEERWTPLPPPPAPNPHAPPLPPALGSGGEGERCLCRHIYKYIHLYILYIKSVLTVLKRQPRYKISSYCI